MPERIVRVTQDGVQEFTRYTKDEIRGFWGVTSQRDVPENRVNRQRRVDENTALELSAIWLRQYCTDPHTVYYAADTGEFVVMMDRVANPAGIRESWRRHLLAYEMVGVDERGPLFADPDAREIRVLELLKLLRDVRQEAPEDLKAMIDARLKEVYA